METLSKIVIGRYFSLTIFFLFLSTALVAQTMPQQEVREDFSDKELKSFVKANEKVMEIQQESLQKMVKAIESEGLSVEKFNELAESQQDPTTDLKASPEELQSFNNAAQQIIQERQKVETSMMGSIEDEGLDVQTYQEILLAYQQSQAVQSKINALLKDGN